MAEFDTIIQIRKYLEEEFAMDNEEIDEMIEILLDSIQRQISELESAISSCDLSKVGGIGHAIKGAAANIGAIYISNIGKNLEMNSDPVKCAEMTEKLQEAITILLNQKS